MRAGTRYGGADAVVSALIVYHNKKISAKKGIDDATVVHHS